MSGPALLQPRPKAPPTSGLPSIPSSPPSRPSSRPPHLQPAATQHRPQRPATPATPAHPSTTSRHDALSDRATAALIRRVLCPSHPLLQTLAAGQEPPAIHELLPPLTSSNALDLQLYAFLAIIVRDNIQSWYNKITPDHTFVDHVIAVIAHCSRALEDRARQVDWEHVLLHDVAEVVTAHIEARNIALAATAAGDPNGASARTIYATLRPHPALQPVPASLDSAVMPRDDNEPVPDKATQQAENEASYRELLAQGVLAILLPSEDIQNPCLTALVSGLLSDLILGGIISQRVCSPAFLFDMIRIGAEYGQTQSKRTKWAADKSLASTESSPVSARSTQGQLSRFGLVNTPSLPSTQGKSAPTLEAHVQHAAAVSIRIVRGLWTQALALWTLVQAIMAYWASGLYLPARHAKDSRSKRDQEAILQLPIWNTLATLLGLTQRMPWLIGAAGLGRHIALTSGVGAANSRIDRLLAEQLYAPFATPGTRLIPNVLRSLRGTLFPNNAAPPPAPAPAAAPPAASATVVGAPAVSQRRAAAFAVLNVLPRAVAQIYLRTDTTTDPVEDMVSDLEENLLGTLDDEFLNKSLVFAVLERLVAALLPELAASDDARGVSEALVERGVLAASAIAV